VDLFEDVAHVALDGPLGDDEGLGDLGVGEPVLGDQAQHVALALDEVASYKPLQEISIVP
jgi:hypothetical protein